MKIVASVIIPVYNSASYLHRCLDSVIKQTSKDIEIIGVDDGSDDDSYDILLDYAKKDKRIITLRQYNMGAGAARNKGMKVANGKYLYFLDADDYIYPDLLQETIAEAERTDADIVVFQVEILNQSDGRKQITTAFLNKQYIPNHLPFSCKDIPQHAYNFTGSVTWNKLYRYEFIKKHSLFYQELQRQNDYYFNYVSLVKAERISIVLKPFVCYQVNTEKKMGSCHKAPVGLIKALTSIRSELMSTGLWGIYEQSFVNMAVRSIRFETNSLLYGNPVIEYADIFCRESTEFLSSCNFFNYKQDFFYESNCWIFTQNIKQGLNFNEYYTNRYLEEQKKLKKQFVKYQTLFENNYSSRNQRQIKISIIIPIYNDEKYLRQCLDSVINQTLKDIEIICVDDCSTDSTREILREYVSRDSRLRLILHESNMKTFMAKKSGVMAASGQYTMFLDHDDYLDLNACEELYAKIKKVGSDILCFGAYINKHGDIPDNQIKRRTEILNTYPQSLSNQEILNACFRNKSVYRGLWNKIYRSELCKKAFNALPETQLHIAEDDYATFALSYFAKSFYGWQGKYFYHNNRGIGVTGRVLLNLDEFEAWCKQALMLDHLHKFMQQQNIFEQHRDIFEYQSKTIFNHHINLWLNQLRTEDIYPGFNILVKYHEKDKVLEELHKQINHYKKIKPSAHKIDQRSYLIGCAITYIPRKSKLFFRCWKTYGFIHTLEATAKETKRVFKLINSRFKHS